MGRRRRPTSAGRCSPPTTPPWRRWSAGSSGTPTPATAVDGEVVDRRRRRASSRPRSASTPAGPLDPQLHTHVVIANRVQSPDGRWLALDARTLKRDQRTLSALYHAGLRAELHRAASASAGDEPGQRHRRDRPIDPDGPRRVLEAHRAVRRSRLATKLDRFRSTHRPRARRPRSGGGSNARRSSTAAPPRPTPATPSGLHAGWRRPARGPRPRPARRCIGGQSATRRSQRARASRRRSRGRPGPGRAGRAAVDVAAATSSSGSSPGPSRPTLDRPPPSELHRLARRLADARHRQPRSSTSPAAGPAGTLRRARRPTR